MNETSNDRLWLVAFGETIAERRQFLAMTQQQLADLSGVHRTYVSDVERGFRNITVRTLNRIATALETTGARILVLSDKKMLELESANQK